MKTNNWVRHETYFSWRKQKTIIVEQWKEIYDDYVRLSSSTSNDHLIDIFRQLEDVDVAVFSDFLIVNHAFYSLIISRVQEILHTWYEANHLTESESVLFEYLIRTLCKTKTSPDQLTQSIEKCLKDIANEGKYLDDKDNIKSFSMVSVRILAPVFFYGFEPGPGSCF